tara:strand:- start:29 stop:292 length:264 start_codon:yes stop_codon:yes gene_type:complete
MEITTTGQVAVVVDVVPVLPVMVVLVGEELVTQMSTVQMEQVGGLLLTLAEILQKAQVQLEMVVQIQEEEEEVHGQEILQGLAVQES